MPDLVELLDRTDLVDLAGEGSYSRGVGYAEAGRVELREIAADRVAAVVAGTSPYRVELATRPRSQHRRERNRNLSARDSRR